MANKVALLSDGFLAFHCPGCDSMHGVRVNDSSSPDSGEQSSHWQWDNSLDQPSITPSVIVNVSRNPGTPYCHFWIRKGEIDFCADSEHSLAGKSVPLPDWR